MNHPIKAAVRIAVAASLLLSTSAVALAGPQAPSRTAPDASGAGKAASGVSGFAVVDATGALVRKLNAKSAARNGGGFEVLFNSKINRCAYTGVVGLPDASGTPPTGYVTVASRSGDLKGVYVETHDATGALAYLPFQLVVTC